jgi:energy-coupling factor transport system permease protein
MWGNGAYSFHVGAWGLWLAAAMLAALGTRNPFYLLLLSAVSILVFRVVGHAVPDRNGGTEEAQVAGGSDEASRGRGLLVRAVVALALIVAFLKGLSIHVGATVLFTLPEGLPMIGGPITLEGMVSAGLDALAILTMLAVFTAFSAGADYYALLRAVPPFMHQAALVTSIAITFVPQTVTRFGEIREAQALRGHRVRRMGDLLPLIMPLLAGGMERSMNLAEAMESRGFSRVSATARRLPPVLVQVGIAGGLGLLLVGGALFAMTPDLPWLAWGLVAVGVGLIVLTLRAVGTGSRRTRYRRTVWRDRDTPLAVVSAGVLALFTALKFVAPSLLVYTPFYKISVPPVDMVVVVAVLALGVPAMILWQSMRLDLRRSRAESTGKV